MNKKMPSANIQVRAETIFGYGLSQDPGSYVELGEKRGKVSLLPFFHFLHPIQLPASLHFHLYWLICRDICECIGMLLQSSDVGGVGTKKIQNWLGSCPCFSCSWEWEEQVYKVRSIRPWSTSQDKLRRLFQINPGNCTSIGPIHRHPSVHR